MNEHRIPPNSQDAEKCVIGTILLSGQAFDEISLAPDDFYREAHREIYQAISEIRAGGAPADLVTISETLRAKNKLEMVGGPAYIASLTDIIPSVAHIQQYAKIVSDHKKRRDAIVAASNIIGMAYESADIETLTEEAQEAFFKIETGSGGMVDMATLVNRSLKNIEARQGENGCTGLSTGFYDLDNSLAGLNAPDLIVLAGRPSMGKTALAMNMVANIAISGVAVGVFSLEMSSDQLTDRMISSDSTVSAGRMRKGHLTEGNWGDISRAAVRLAKTKISIDDSPSLSVAEIRRRARKLKMKDNIGLVVVDYLQMATSSKHKSREQEISDISRQLKGMAKELAVPVLAVAQLSRKLEERSDKKPIPSDLRDSGQIEQDADVIMFVYRDEIYNKAPNNPEKGLAEIIIAKQRNGPLGMVKLAFHGETMTFRNLA